MIRFIFILGVFICVKSFACTSSYSERELAIWNNLRYDYRAYIRNPAVKKQNRYITTDSPYDFVKTFPEGETKEGIIKTVYDAYYYHDLSIIMLLGMEYHPHKNELILKQSTFGCTTMSRLIRKLLSLQYLSNPVMNFLPMDEVPPLFSKSNTPISSITMTVLWDG